MVNEKTYSIRVRVQLLYPLNGVILALWKYQYLRNVKRLHDIDRVTLRTHAYHRLNAHEGLIDYVYTIEDRDGEKTAENCNNGLIDDQDCTKIGKITINFKDTKLRVLVDPTEHMRERAAQKRCRLNYMQQLLSNTRDRRQTVNDINHTRTTYTETNANTNGATFWQSNLWWREQLSENYESQFWWRRTDGTHEFNRICRLLNHLVRRLTNEHNVSSVDTAVRLLMTANEQECRMLSKLYVEPSMTSLFVAYLSTTFMHHKQQHGLNTKHAAAKNTDQRPRNNEENRSSSKRSFDPKIYLDMCSSCDKKDIFELMLSLDKSVHRDIPCHCTLCNNLCQIANAWRFYDCTDRSWLRLEFNRKFYNKISNLLGETILADECKTKNNASEHTNQTSSSSSSSSSSASPFSSTSSSSSSASISTSSPSTLTTSSSRTKTTNVKIVYLSYKNEFTDRTNFISNFVNYYAFYENGEQPVSKFDNNQALREKISILFVFALINWQLIAKAIAANTAHNSISLNQQSIFKSLDNTLYAIFSENSINRMSKEQKQRLLNINAPYVNRGFGALPNSGMNAITTTIMR